MTDFVAYILQLFAKTLVRLFGLILLPISYLIAAINKDLNGYNYEAARGWDILANKLFAPAFNKWLGPGFGGDETISQRMAKNKLDGSATKTAAFVEKIINLFDKNHLQKTLDKMSMNN